MEHAHQLSVLATLYFRVWNASWDSLPYGEANKKCLCFLNHLGSDKFLINPLQWDLDD